MVPKPKATHTNTTPMPAPDVAPVPPTASVDAPLLALAAEFQTVDARLMAINDEITADTTDTLSMDKGEPAAVHDRWWAIVNRVIDQPAHTQAGWAAKAAMIPPVIRDVSSTAIGTADINLALSLARDLTGQADPGPDRELLAACETFHRIHAEMKDPRRGDTDADDDALGLVVERWYTALDAAVAIPARTAVGQQAKLRTVYTALWDAMKDEPLFGNREEFAALAALRELLGDAADPAAKSALVPAASVRALSVLEIGRHLREASGRYDAVGDGASNWLLDELLGWRRLALTRPPATLLDAATQLAVLFDHMGELDTQVLEARPECLDLLADLRTAERVVAGLVAAVARIAGLDITTVVDETLPSRLAKHVPGAEVVA